MNLSYIEDRLDGWLYNKDGIRIRPWFTTGGRHGEIRIFPPKRSKITIAWLEAKCWEIYHKLMKWRETKEEPLRQRMSQLTSPVIGTCPDDATMTILLHPKRMSWTWLDENISHHPKRGECVEDQNFVNEVWYAHRRARTMERAFAIYNDLFHQMVEDKYLQKMKEEDKSGCYKYKASKLFVNGREYLVRLHGNTHTGFSLEFEVRPEDMNILVIDEN